MPTMSEMAAELKEVSDVAYAAKNSGSAHELVCAERYKGINDKLGLLFWVLAALVGGIFATLGWMATTIYDLQPARLAARPAAVSGPHP